MLPCNPNPNTNTKTPPITTTNSDAQCSLLILIPIPIHRLLHRSLPVNSDAQRFWSRWCGWQHLHHLCLGQWGVSRGRREKLSVTWHQRYWHTLLIHTPLIHPLNAFSISMHLFNTYTFSIHLFNTPSQYAPTMYFSMYSHNTPSQCTFPPHLIHLNHPPSHHLLQSLGSLFEGGVRVDAFVYSTKIPESLRGTEYQHLFHVSDWFPTILR